MIVWLWVHGGNVTDVHTTGELLTSIGRITGLLGAYLALIQVVLLARLPWLERLVGFDRLTVWHRWNGHACLDLDPRARRLHRLGLRADGQDLAAERDLDDARRRHLPGDDHRDRRHRACSIAVVVTSVVIVRRRLRYEWWYAVHLLAYAGIALAWFHQIPTGNELVLDRVAADYWRALYLATIALARRLPGRWCRSSHAFRYRLRVAEVVAGRPRRRLAADHGTPARPARRAGRASSSSGASSTAAAGGRRTRSRSRRRRTGARCASPSRRSATSPAGSPTCAPGTRVVAEGPFGVFTDGGPPPREGRADRRRHRHHADPRADRGACRGDVVVLYRVVADEDVLFRDELDALAARARHPRALRRRRPRDRGEARPALVPSTCTELVPDIVEREVYVCGPPAMTEVARAQRPRAQRFPRA